MGVAARGTTSRSDLLFDQLLEQVRIEVDSALDGIAADPDQARRICTRDLRFEADARALEAIEAIAGDPSLSGPRRELPRRLLTLRVVAERELASLFAGAELDTQRLRRGTVVVSAVLDAYEPLRVELQHAVGLASPDDRSYLAGCESAIAVPREDLCASLLLVPRVEAFSQAEDESAVRATAPTLSEGEARRVMAFVDGREGARGEAHRACFDALVLRSLMEEHLVLLDDVLERAQPESTDTPIDDAEASEDDPQDASPNEEETPEDEAVEVAAGEVDAQILAELDQLLGRIEADRVGYQFVSRRLQEQKDMALVAGLKSLVEELGHVGKGLFSSYRMVIARSRDAAALSEVEREGEVLQAEELFRQSVAAEIEAEQRVVETSDEACLRALKQIRRGETAIGKATGRLRRAAKNRSKPLAAIAALLVGVSIWFNVDLTEHTAPEQLTYADFASGLNVSDFTAAGSTLYVQVNGWSLLDTVQRRTRAESIAAIAEEKGYARLLMAEESGFPAATWDPEKGTKLAPAKFTTPRGR